MCDTRIQREVPFKMFVKPIKLWFHLADHVVLMLKRFPVNTKWLQSKLYLTQVKLIWKDITCILLPVHKVTVPGYQ